MPKSVYTEAYQVLLRELVEHRRSAGITQQELAEKLEKPQSFISKFERGERRLDVVEFLEIARVIGADAQAILEKIAAELPGKGGRSR